MGRGPLRLVVAASPMSVVSVNLSAVSEARTDEILSAETCFPAGAAADVHGASFFARKNPSIDDAPYGPWDGAQCRSFHPITDGPGKSVPLYTFPPPLH